MNTLVCKEIHDLSDCSDRYLNVFPQLEVQGAKELELLCPVSKLTGFPMSLQEAVMYITDKNARIADVLFEVLPTIPSDDSISDEEKMSMLVSRLDTGSFAENDNVAEILGKVARQFFPAADVDKVVETAQAKINFEPSDTPSAE